MRLRLLAVLVVGGALVAPANASACSCAAGSASEMLRQSDAAVIAKLKDVRPVSDDPFGEAKFIYRIRRVFKGRHQYDLHAGDRLVIRSYLDGGSCGLPQQRRLYGMFLFERRGELEANLCTVTSPKRLRRAAARRDGAGARLASAGKLCGQRVRV